tara:strand:- start:1703 stop:1822 length:120 start_codon:yes stop_codon:yes gene_type:complete
MSNPNEPPKPATADAPEKELTPEEKLAKIEEDKDKLITE